MSNIEKKLEHLFLEESYEEVILLRQELPTSPSPNTIAMLAEAYFYVGKQICEKLKPWFVVEGGDDDSKKKLAFSILCFNEALDLKPNEAKYYLARGKAFQTKKFNEQAIKDFKKAIELEPTDGDFYYELGMCYFPIQNYAMVIQYLSRCIDLNSFNSAALYWRGQSYYYLGNIGAATQDLTKTVKLGNKKAVELLEKVQKELTIENNSKKEEHAIQTLENLARRFPIYVRELQKRQRDRQPVIITDEYDVQDIFRALLYLHFRDVRPETWTPSYAGGNSRVDFYLYREGVFVEIKKTRDGLRARDVADQLIKDIYRYQSDVSHCKALFAFVYDPEGRIDNPEGLETDLSKSHNGMPVKVVISS